jgi:hypothetical protein
MSHPAVPALHPELVPPPAPVGVAVVTVVVVIVKVFGLVVEVAAPPELPLFEPGAQLSPRLLELLPLEVQTSSWTVLPLEDVPHVPCPDELRPAPAPPVPLDPNEEGAPVLDIPPS